MNVCIMPLRKKTTTCRVQSRNQSIAKARSPLDVSERWGAWMRGLTLVISLAVTAVALAACGRANGEDKGGKGGFPPAPVSVQEVKTTTVPIRFEYVGQTAGSKEAEVRARVQGILEKRTYQEGSKVAAGQTQFKCAPPIRERSNRELLWGGLAVYCGQVVKVDFPDPTSPWRLPLTAASSDPRHGQRIMNAARLTTGLRALARANHLRVTRRLPAAR